METLRLIAVRRVVEDGESASEVMRSLGLCRTSIYPWLRKHRKKGEAALKMSKAAGPAPKLSGKQCSAVRRWIVGKDPRQYGFDFGLWTRRIVAELIKEKLGVQLRLTAVGRLLARLNITPQKPLRRAYERDPKAVEQWVAQDDPRLRRRARRLARRSSSWTKRATVRSPRWAEPMGSRGRLRWSAQPRRRKGIAGDGGWASPGRDRKSMRSARSTHGADFGAKSIQEMLNAGRLVEFLKDFRRGGRGKVFLVVDGHPSHRAKVVAEDVASCRGMLELNFLPPDAPDLNPDEFVWQNTKTNGVSKKPLKQNESLKQRVTSDLAAIKAQPKLLLTRQIDSA